MNSLSSAEYLQLLSPTLDLVYMCIYIYFFDTIFYFVFNRQLVTLTLLADSSEFNTQADSWNHPYNQGTGQLPVKAPAEPPFPSHFSSLVPVIELLITLRMLCR